jgi:hypothetical protein
MWGKSKPKRVNSGAEELTNEDVSEEQWISAESGIPEGADFLAYEPIQRLLAVSGRQCSLHGWSRLPAS